MDVAVHEPPTLDELGISTSTVYDIVLRRTLLDGEASTLRLAEHLALSPFLMEQAVEDLLHKRLLEVQGRDHGTCCCR